MKFSTADLHTDRQWRAATGLDQKRFTKLLALLPDAYQQLYGQNIQQRQQQCPDEPMLDSYEDLLLFTLFSLKSGLTFDLLGLTTGMDGSTAKRNRSGEPSRHWTGLDEDSPESVRPLTQDPLRQC